MWNVPKWLMAVVAVVMVILWTGCGPSKPEIATTVQQTFQAMNLSILSQVDWKQVMTSLHGKVGPDFALVIEGYTKVSAGCEVRVRGGEVEIDTQASGTGGGDNKWITEALNQVQQRWERADDANKADKRKWTQEVIDAILKGKATTQPAEAGDLTTAPIQ